VKLADVAKKASVSVTTVSRVLNGEENVRASTRSRVQGVIEELKYYPNLHARSLAGGQSKTLGMIVSNLDNPFFLDVYRRFESLAMQKGFETIVAASHYDPGRLRAILHSMIGRRLAGIAAIVSETPRELVSDLIGFGIPVVVYDFARPGKGVTNIRSNYKHGMRQMVEYLYGLGHRRMAFIAYPVPLGPTEDRRQAFLDTMAQQGGEARVISAHADGYLGGREATRELLDSGFLATAILCINDITAVGVLKELNERAICVPDQISVTGFDNIQLAQFTIPSLTTVNIPRDRIAELSFESLVPTRPSGWKQGRDFLLEPELILRHSSGPAAGQVTVRATRDELHIRN
jgi:DNA-binding LacI/PurR family transcriptional regulator